MSGARRATMRIIAGELKGRRVETPRGETTRPTADHVRLALMDALTPWLAGARVLDLFAGGGGVGLEALSRGAAHATFVERDARALRALRANVTALGVADRARVVRADAKSTVRSLAGTGERFSIIFLDPPYQESVDPLLLEIAQAPLLTEGGVVVAQHLTKHGPRDVVDRLRQTRARRFGETTLTFFRPTE